MGNYSQPNIANFNLGNTILDWNGFLIDLTLQNCFVDQKQVAPYLQVLFRPAKVSTMSYEDRIRKMEVIFIKEMLKHSEALCGIKRYCVTKRKNLYSINMIFLIKELRILALDSRPELGINRVHKSGFKEFISLDKAMKKRPLTITEANDLLKCCQKRLNDCSKALVKSYKPRSKAMTKYRDAVANKDEKLHRLLFQIYKTARLEVEQELAYKDLEKAKKCFSNAGPQKQEAQLLPKKTFKKKENVSERQWDRLVQEALKNIKTLQEEKMKFDFSSLQDTQAKELSSARILEDARKMEFISEMMASQEMDIFKDVDPGFSEITKQSRKYLNELFKNSPLVDRDERILEGIIRVYETVAGINDEAIDYYVGQDSLEHQRALHKFMEASKNVCEQENILERYKDRVYDLSDISPKTREKLGLDEYEVFSDISDLDEEMLRLTFSHIKETEVIQEKYAGRKWASRAIEENLECLKQVVESIKSGDTEKAFKLLENNWAVRQKVGFRCLFHDSVDFVEGFGQGLYSGAKRAINVPQRIVDLYNTAKGLGRILGRIGEIDMLVKQGNLKAAQEKWRALENDLSTKFSAMWEGIKQKWEHATPGEVGFFLGELTGDGMTTQQMCKWTQKLTKVLTPKIKEAKRKAKKAITEFVQKGKDKTKGMLNPASSKTVTTPEGVTVKVDTPTSQSTITKKTSQGKTHGSKTKKGSSNKKKTETSIVTVQKEKAAIPGIVVEANGKIKIDKNLASLQYTDRLKKLGLRPEFTKSCLSHIRHGHYPDGANYLFNLVEKGIPDAIFNLCENFIELSLTALEKGKKIGPDLFIYDFGRVIGKSRLGLPSTKIHVVLNGTLDAVRTAYPV